MGVKLVDCFETIQVYSDCEIREFRPGIKLWDPEESTGYVGFYF